MKTISPSRLLKNALVADAIVSGGVAVLQLTAANFLSTLLSLPRSTLIGAGAFLVAYTVLLMVLATRPRVWPSLIAFVVLGNVLWAMGCIGFVGTSRLSPNALGVAYVMIQAIAVLGFAAWEYAGLTRSSDRPGAPRAGFAPTVTPAHR